LAGGDRERERAGANNKIVITRDIDWREKPSLDGDGPGDAVFSGYMSTSRTLSDRRLLPNFGNNHRWQRACRFSQRGDAAPYLPIVAGFMPQCLQDYGNGFVARRLVAALNVSPAPRNPGCIGKRMKVVEGAVCHDCVSISACRRAGNSNPGEIETKLAASRSQTLLIADPAA
jgi:hypothetical protein